MNSSTFAFIAFYTCVYISSSISTAYGYKCSGKWAIHACFGGNGKRSGPLQKSLDSTNVRDLSARQYSLRDLLLPEGFASRVPTNNELLLDARDVDTDVDSLYPDIEGYARAKDLEKARMMLSELMFQRHARNSLSSDFVDFKR
ncbi:uncharacterized protein LOC128236877 [Mya arenaria]|uniref:uncharacterized protein LOC128236877 n=1 Tax=Mya arenaria TaxID=6604 RepID=UPI0022E0DDFA|nr:uncharacterized protein LOC128236877 [Mya arenaria]